MDTDARERLNRCERSYRRLTWLVRAQSAVLVVLIVPLLLAVNAIGGGYDAGGTEGRLRIAELIVVDKKGVERVRIGGDLPDAVVDGRRVPRGEKAAGVLLYDGAGRERGGYVTWEPSGNVGLTLDSRKRQATLFVAGAEGGSALKLWDGEDSIELRSDDDGSRVTAVRNGQIVYQEPAIDTLGDEACAAYRDALSQYSTEEVLNACRQRYSEAACRACLETQ
jgi:hypothetical protein